jgi:APA family basic amino acid/polyamine antiporter
MALQQELKRGLNLFDSTAIVAGSMIGSGIFIVSADMARTLGSSGWLIAAWILTGLITITAALSYGELAAMMPQAGGMYVYLREAYGKLPAFLYGWTLFAVIQSGTIAAVSVAFAKFAGVIFPAISSSQWIFKFLFFDYVFGLNTQNLLAIISIIFLTWINTRGLESGKWLQNIFTSMKVLSLLMVILLGFTVGKNIYAINANFSDLWNASFTHVLKTGINVEELHGVLIFGALGAAMVGSLFSAIAWDTVTYTAGETINPKKNIPLSLAIGTGVVILLYILVNISYLFVLPLEGNINGSDVYERGIQFALDDRVGTAVFEAIFGTTGAIIMALLIMVSTFGCNNGIILSTARVYYAMAKDGLFFKKAGELNTKQVPSFALIIQCIWSCILCLSGKYMDLLDYVIFAILLFYILTILALFVLRIKKPDAERPYKAFGYPFIPVLYIFFACAISIDLLIYKPFYTWPGLVIVFLGIPVYYLLGSRIHLLGCNSHHKT